MVETTTLSSQESTFTQAQELPSQDRPPTSTSFENEKLTTNPNPNLNLSDAAENSGILAGGTPITKPITKSEPIDKPNTIDNPDNPDKINNPDNMEYYDKIDYLLPEDEKLIHKDIIIQQVNKYISNYYSDNYKKYKKNFAALYQKYSNKKYRIDNQKDSVIVAKLENPNKKSTKSDNMVYELKKPKYIYYNLIDMKLEISNARNELQFKYQKLINKIEVLPDEKAEFEKSRKRFIKLLETYYIYNLYDIKINNKNYNNTMDITFQNIIEYSNDNNNLEKKYILDGNIYKISNNLIESINKENKNKLDEYNKIINKLKNINNIKDKVLIDEIKNYIDKTNIKNIENQMRLITKTQETQINFIVNFEFI